MNYKEYKFIIEQVEVFRDIFIAELAQIGFEGFVENENGFSAFTNQELNFSEILDKYNIDYQYTTKIVIEENWNKTWEKQIKPLVIDDKIYIKTSFHPDKNLPMQITIDPKMSFGTGHHETTYLMIKQMFEIDFADKSVLDMGAGTGVLSIIAHKYGAKSVFAVDIDKWSYENMIENFEKNDTTDIKSYLGDASILSSFDTFDIVLANINRNILLNDIQYYTQKLRSGGILVLSGFYTQGIPIVSAEAQKYGMVFEKQFEKNNWVSLKFTKK